MMTIKAATVASVLLALSAAVSLSLLTAPSSRAAASNSRLAFAPDEGGGFRFDTGVVRGKLRPKGRGIGLSSVQHIPTGVMLDQGDKGYGIFSHYRVFTTGKRYGGGAWDWPGTASLGEDGTVEVRWPASEGRPFVMRALYRWSGPDTLDLETIVEAGADLSKFESFLASYFAKGFTNALVYREGPQAGQAGFLPAEKSLGDWQMAPRDDAAAGVIQDGRWQIEPNPVKWTILPKMLEPIAVRRDPGSGVAAALASTKDDCFAIAMPHQAEGHYSVYLSLFGRDLKKGETARARARLLVAPTFSEQKILTGQRELISSRQPGGLPK